MHALEATGMEESEVFERSYPVHLVDDFVASQTAGFVKIWSIHIALSICHSVIFTRPDADVFTRGT